jgi:hypothetical protein
MKSFLALTPPSWLWEGMSFTRAAKLGLGRALVSLVPIGWVWEGHEFHSCH